MAHPTIIDIGTDEDAGEWLAAFPYCRFPIEEHRPRTFQIPTLGSGIEGHPADTVTSGGGTTGTGKPLRMDGNAETFNDTGGDHTERLAPVPPVSLSLHASLTTDEGERNHGVR